MSERAVDLARAWGPRVASDRLRHDVEVLAAGPRSRLREPRAMADAEEYVAEELRSAGWRVRRQPFDVRWRVGSTDRRGNRALALKARLHPRLRGSNLIAALPGAPTGPVVVLGAHLDTVEESPGADDNGSGVAVLLESARLLATLPEAPPVVLAVFDMEELGLIGSRFAVRALSRERPITGMMCLESVGYFSDAPGSQRLPRGFSAVFPGAASITRRAGFRGDFTLVVHRRSSAEPAVAWQRAAEHTAPALPGILLRDPRPDGLPGTLIGLAVPPANHVSRSDHAPFWNAGIPALMLTGTANFRNAEYHRSADTPDRLDYSRLAAVTAATAATATAWARPSSPGH